MPSALTLLAEGEQHERAGAPVQAIACFNSAIEAAESRRQHDVLSDALRRLAVVHHHQGDQLRAQALVQRALGVAVEIGDTLRAARALNALAGFDFETGEIESAEQRYRRAIELGGDDPVLRGRVEQNLGILANIRGDLQSALAHYERAHSALASVGEEQGLALALHNQGMVNADLRRWSEAERCYEESLAIAERAGMAHLKGLVLLNRAEVMLAQHRTDQALASAEAALVVFNQLDSRLDKADTYQMIGRVYRETGRPQLAESRLRSAIELAVATGSVLSEAEASRELALLYQQSGRNQEALTLLNASHRLFGRLDARKDLVDVDGKRARLESTYLRVVREWGQSIESADSYTHGHCERVATLGEAVGRLLGLDEEQLTALRLGAYLHDLGKVKVPHEILNKPGRLTDEEFAIVQQHPAWGVELLATVEFPWDIKPIIRWHHEKYDGTGYPDRLVGEEIPLGAQIICAVDVYDALTTTRSYRKAMSHDEAIMRMQETRHWWRPDVFEALLGASAQVLKEAA